MLGKIDKTYWVALLIISLISGIILGFIGPNFIHQVLFKYGDTFLVLTPFSANILMLVAVVFFVMFCIGMIFENKLRNYIGIFSLVVSIALGYYAISGNYKLISENDITIKKSMTKEVYQWSDIQEAVYIYKTGDGSRQFQLHFENGKKETVKITSANYGSVDKIKQNLYEHNIYFRTK